MPGRDAYHAKLRAKRAARTGGGTVGPGSDLLAQGGIPDDAPRAKGLKAAASGRTNSVQKIVMDAVMARGGAPEAPAPGGPSAAEPADASPDEEAPPAHGGLSAAEPADASSDEEAPPAPGGASGAQPAYASSDGSRRRRRTRANRCPVARSSRSAPPRDGPSAASARAPLAARR